MNSVLKAPDWYTDFKNWIEKPSPTGNWIYRGQPAKYDSIIPSLLRKDNRRYYRIMLFDIDCDISEFVLSSSPIFGQNRLFPNTISDELSNDY